MYSYVPSERNELCGVPYHGGGVTPVETIVGQYKVKQGISFTFTLDDGQYHSSSLEYVCIGWQSHVYSSCIG